MEAHQNSPAASSTYSEPRGNSIDTTHSSLRQRLRPLQVPSYMHAALPHQPPAIHTPQNHSISNDVPAQSQPQRKVDNGLLIVAIASFPNGDLKEYVERLLQKSPSSSLVIIGPWKSEAALKQLKMEMYSIAGRLGIELGMHLIMHNEWTAGVLEGAMAQALQISDTAPGALLSENATMDSRTGRIKGLICCPEASHQSEMLSIDSQELASSWWLSVGFLHAAAKAIIPYMIPRTRSVSTTDRLRGPFVFITDASPLNDYPQSIHKPSMCALLETLDRSYGHLGIAFGYVEQELPPNPEPEHLQVTTNNGNGPGKLPVDTHIYGDPFPDGDVGDSPTKLWGMWANANID